MRCRLAWHFLGTRFKPRHAAGGSPFPSRAEAFIEWFAVRAARSLGSETVSGGGRPSGALGGRGRFQDTALPRRRPSMHRSAVRLPVPLPTAGPRGPCPVCPAHSLGAAGSDAEAVFTRFLRRGSQSTRVPCIFFPLWVGTSCCDLEGGGGTGTSHPAPAGDTASDPSTVRRALQTPWSPRTLPGTSGGRGPIQPPGAGEAAQCLQEPVVAIGQDRDPQEGSAAPSTCGSREFWTEQAQGPGPPALRGAERLLGGPQPSGPQTGTGPWPVRHRAARRR